MKIIPPNEDAILLHSTGIGPVTRQMVRDRAAELAVIGGRAASEPSPSDWEQAKRELTGGSDLDPEEAALEAAPESERWDPVPGSTGHVVPVPSVNDEDEDGRSFSVRLVEEGVKEAGHDQMLQAARDAEKKDPREP